MDRSDIRPQIDTVNPATGQVLCSVARGDATDVDRAVSAARQAFEGEWSRWTPHQRRKLILKIHDIVLDHFDELALIETMDMGAPLSRTRGLAEWTSQVLQFFASQCDAATVATPPNSLPGDFLTLKSLAPVGVVGGIIPWNGPLIGLWWIFGPALATGCTAVLKPAEDASLSVLRVAELMMEAGVPDGVINVVTGYGAMRARLWRNIGTSTGSRSPDRSAPRRPSSARPPATSSVCNWSWAASRPTSSSPMPIWTRPCPAPPWVCSPTAARSVSQARGSSFNVRSTTSSSSACRNSRRPSAWETDSTRIPVGPLISERQLERVMHYINLGGDEGARLASGGNRLGGELASGYFVEPTVFAGASNDMTIAREEIFGPVAR